MDLRQLDDGISVLVPEGMESEGFLVAFTDRGGGVSKDAFRSLNLGLRCGDDPGNALTNRERLRRALEMPPFSLARQVHGARVVAADGGKGGAGFEDPSTALGDADAIVTSTRGHPVAVLVADCVPVALAHPPTGRLAVAHAGWRGVVAGVLPAALGHFEKPSEVLAAVGPAVGPDHYEVGEEVVGAVSGASEQGAITTWKASQIQLNLPATVTRILRELGVRNIEWDETCTACEPDRFFSHRRDGITGRQALLAMRR